MIFSFRPLRLTAALFLLAQAPFCRAAGSVCASVKMEVQQELTLERQAFDAHMRINNGYTTLTLEKVSVTVKFMDKDQNPVVATSDPNDLTAKFFVRVDTLDGISDVSGTGVVGASSSADIHWLIIPAPGTAGNAPSGALYFVGADLSYSIGGEPKSMSVTPDHITVQPMPLLSLDYFLPSEVTADDAFTPEVEAPVPFPLGVRVRNSGFGAARALKIESAQPTIVDNARGLLIGFNITGSDVNGVPSPLSLLADFGNVAPGGSGVARWTMTTTLSGKFTNFSAQMTHADALGGALTSLFTGVASHILVKDVMVDAPGRDSVPDFLAVDGGGLRLYDSEAADVPVADLSAASSFQSPSAMDTFPLSTPFSPGFIYVQLSDPRGGTRPLSRVIRSDGKVLKPSNAWLSKTRQGNGPWQYHFNLFDDGIAPGYTVVFGDPASDNRPPVFQPIPDVSGVESQPLSFTVRASDPENAPVTLSVAGLPVGAAFSDNHDGTGLFSWTPATGQAGRYEAVFTASDGALSASARAVVAVGVPDGNLRLTDLPDWITFSTPTWTWTAQPGATGYLVHIDDAPEVILSTNTYTASSLLDGKHVFSVRARYGANTGVSQTDAFGVDTLAPVLWSVSLNGGALGTADRAVSVDDSDDRDGLGSGVSLRESSVDGGPFSPLSGGSVTLPATYGTHTVALRLTDAVGHVSQVRESAIVYAHAVQSLSGTSASGDTAILQDLRSPLRAEVSVVNGGFRFDAVPAGLYGLLVRNGAASAAYPARISLLEGHPVGVGSVEPGFQGGGVSGVISPRASGVPVAAGSNLGQGYFLELARTLTDAEGNYSLSGLAPGSALVVALPDPSSGLASASTGLDLIAGTTVQANLSLPAAVRLSGGAGLPGLFLKAVGPLGSYTSFQTDRDGRYALSLSTGGYSLSGISGYHRLAPVPVFLSTAPLTRDLLLQTLDVSTAAVVSDTSLLLDSSADPGVFKSLQACAFQGAADPAGFPYVLPLSEELSDSSVVSFRLYGNDPPLCLLSDDPARDIHAGVVAPAALTGVHQYSVTGTGVGVEGSVLLPSGVPAVKPVLLLLSAGGAPAGVSEGGFGGGYFFKGVPAADRYGLVAVDPFSGRIGASGPFSLQEGQTPGLRDLTLSASPGLAIVTYPASATAGQSVPVTIAWSGADPSLYNLVLRITNDASLSAETTLELPGATGARTFQAYLPPSAPSASGYIYAFVNNKLTGWSGRLAEARTAPGTISVQGAPPSLTVTSVPSTAYLGMGAPVGVSWSGVDTGRFNLGLRIIAGGVVKLEQFFELPAAQGNAPFAVTVPVNAPLGKSTVDVYAYVDDKTVGWPGRTAETTLPKKDVTVKAPLILGVVPSTVTAGGTAPIPVTWENVDATRYDLGLRISSGGSVLIEQHFPFPSAQGTASFALNVPAGTPAGKMTVDVSASISDKTTGWVGRLYEVAAKNKTIAVVHP